MLIDKNMRARVGKEDEGRDKKVAGPPVDVSLQPPADRVAIQHDDQPPARRKHRRGTLSRSAQKVVPSACSPSPRPPDVQEVSMEPAQHRSVSLSKQPAAAVKAEGRN